MENVFHVKVINKDFITVEFKKGAVLTGGFKVVNVVGVTVYTVMNEHTVIVFETYAAHGGVDNFIIRSVYDNDKDRFYTASRFTKKYYALVKGFHDTLLFKWNQEMKRLKEAVQ
jgi:hypothetical protein